LIEGTFCARALVPTEAELDALIAGSGYKTAAFLQLLKETAMRPGEPCKLTWNDFDLVSKTVRVTPEKGSNPRIFPVSDKLLNMLLSIKQGNHIRDPDKIFASQLRHYTEILRTSQEEASLQTTES
jgi:integrase